MNQTVVSVKSFDELIKEIESLSAKPSALVLHEDMCVYGIDNTQKLFRYAQANGIRFFKEYQIKLLDSKTPQNYIFEYTSESELPTE